MLTLEDEILESKLIKLSKESGKSIKDILNEMIDNFSRNSIDEEKTLKYKKLNPKDYSKKIEYNIEDSSIDKNTKPFKNIKDVAKFAKELREKNWRS